MHAPVVVDLRLCVCGMEQMQAVYTQVGPWPALGPPLDLRELPPPSEYPTFGED